MKLLSNSDARRTAVILYKGPGYLEIEPDDVNFIYGNRLLWLGRNQTGPTRWESRALYLLPPKGEEPEQSVAVVRGIYWRSTSPYGRITERHADGTISFHLIGERQPTYPTSVAVRFVAIPIGQSLGWIAHVDHLPLVFHLHDLPPRGEERRIELEWNQRLSLAWETRHPDYAEVNARWTALWRWMGDALRDRTPLTGIKENFTTTEEPDREVYDDMHYPPLERDDPSASGDIT